MGFFRKRKVRALDDLAIDRGGQIFGFLAPTELAKLPLKLLPRLIFPTSNCPNSDHDISEIECISASGICQRTYLRLSDGWELNTAANSSVCHQRKRQTSKRPTRTRQSRRRRWDTTKKPARECSARWPAQSLVNDPEIVFLDEPMSGLDPVGRREVRDLIASLREEDKTVFMCSHILSDIEVLCDEVAIMKRGRLSQVGHRDELRHRTDDPTHMEVLATGTDEVTLRRYLSDAEITASPRGLRIEIANEEEIEKVLAALRQAGGKLVSVQPIKQSLEELFLSDPRVELA